MNALIERIDALSIRERGIILAAVLFVLYTLWDGFLIQPQTLESRRLVADLQLKRAEQSVANAKFQKLLREQNGNGDMESRQRLAQLKQQLEQIDRDVKQTTAHLVAPQDMARILQIMLSRTGGLEPIEIKGLGASPLLGGSEGDAPTSSDGGLDNAWKHGLLIRFEGDYMSTLRYMQALESLEWKFFWEKVEYEVLDYPRARVALTLSTLSLEKDWIGG